MPDAVLKIGAVVDKDAIVTGMADGAGEVDKATVKMATSFTELSGAAKTAWKKISDDTKAAANAVTSDSLRIAESTKAVSQAQAELRAALRLSSNASVDAAMQTKLLAAAQDGLRIKSLELKAAQEAVAVASHQTVTGVQATSAAIRSIEGNGGIRAIEQFMAKTLGLGPAMQAIFPVVGGLLFAKMLFDVGQKMDEVYEKAIGAKDAITDAFSAMHERAAITITDLEIVAAKLQLEIDKVEKHPGNGLALALLEGKKYGEELQATLRKDRDELDGLLKEHDVSGFARAISGVASTGQQHTQLMADQRQLSGAIAAANGQYNTDAAAARGDEDLKRAAERRDTAIHAAIQKQIDTYRAEGARLKKEQSSNFLLPGFMQEDMGALRANIEGRTNQLIDMQREADARVNVAGLTAKKQKEEQAKEDAQLAKQQASEAREQARQAASEHLRAIETQFAEMDSKLPEAAIAFWRSYLGAFQSGSSEYLHIVEQVNHYTAEFEKGLNLSHGLREAMKKVQENQAMAPPEAVQHGLDEFNKHFTELGEDITRTGARWDGYNRALAAGTEFEAQHQAAMEEGRIRILESQHALTPLAAAQQLAAIHTQQHTAALKALEAELAQLQAEGASLRPGDKGYEENATKQASVGNQIQQQKGSAEQQAQGDGAAISAAVAQPYLRAFDSINSGWLKVQNDLIAGNKNIVRDFQDMGLHLLQGMAANFEKMIVAHAQMEMRMLMAHQIGNAQKAASDAVASETSASLQRKSALKEAFVDAKSASIKAYKAMAGIPVIGPELGAVAAGVTFAAVMSLAAFEKGGIVGGMPGMAVPILAHSGERVLTTQQTNNFERMVNNNSTGGGGLHLNFGGNSFSHAGSDFKSQWAAHERHIVTRLKTLHREGHLNFAG